MAFVNLKPGTLLAPVPAVLVSCARKGEKPNAVTIAWAGTVNSDPPMCSISVRPERYSHDIIEETGEFVINLCGEENLKATDWCGVKSGRDFDKFKEEYINSYYSKIAKWEYRRRKTALRAIDSQEKYKEDYPAHLHIDILPEYQHMGLGRKLMDALCDNLRQKNVKGVMFTVWHKNYSAIKFYEKYGFRLIETKETTLVYGLKLK